MPASTLRKSALALALTAVLGTLGCSPSVDSLVASGDAAMAKGDYRTAQIQLKSALQQDGNNVRARWLLGELSLATEDGAAAEKEIRRAGELGVGNDAVIPALAQALLLQGKVEAVLELEPPASLSPRARGEVLAAQGVAQLAKGEKARAAELTTEALKLAPDSRFATSARVRVLIDANRLDEAEQILATLQQAHPDYGVAWTLLGDVQDRRGDAEKAEQSYTTAAQKRPAPYEDLLKRAAIRLGRQDLDGAFADAQAVAKALPNVQPAWYVIGAVHFQKKEFAKAQEALDRSYQLNNDHVPTLILLGWSNLNLGNVGQANAQANRALSIAPNVVGARLLMANLYLGQQPPAGKQAEDLVRPVVDARPDDLAAKSLLAKSLTAQGKRLEAAPLLEQMAGAAPESLDLQAVVGLELLKAGFGDRALAVLGRAVQRAPDSPRPNAALVATMLQQKKGDEALAVAQRFHEQDPKDVAALRLLAETQLATGHQAEAVATYRNALEVAPGDPPSAVRLAEFLTRGNDLDGARTVLEDALAKHPDEAGLLVVLSQVVLRQGQASEAKGLLARAVEKDPNHFTARLLLAGSLMGENDFAGALRVLPADPNTVDARVLAARSQANLRLEDFDKARDDLERLAALQPQSALVQFELANVHGALGDAERMHGALDAAARLDPRSPAIGAAHARSLAIRGKTAEASAVVARLGLPETDATRLAVELLIAEQTGNRAEQLRASESLFKVQPSTQSVLAFAQARAAAGQSDAAAGVLRDWVVQHEQDDVVWSALAEFYGRTGRADQAVPIFRKLVARHPDNALLLNNLAWYLKDSDPKEALRIAAQAYRVAAERGPVVDTYVLLLARNGQIEEALATVERSVAVVEEPAMLRLRRAELLALKGDQEGAKAELDELRSSGPPPGLQGLIDSLAGRLATGRQVP
jgi:putative PEP-CTERM system TPR-repeat lipoprotein